MLLASLSSSRKFHLHTKRRRNSKEDYIGRIRIVWNSLRGMELEQTKYFEVEISKLKYRIIWKYISCLLVFKVILDFKHTNVTFTAKFFKKNDKVSVGLLTSPHHFNKTIHILQIHKIFRHKLASVFVLYDANQITRFQTVPVSYNSLFHARR